MSEQPLFPSGTQVKQKPLQAGWYMRKRVYRANRNLPEWDVSWSPMYLDAKDGTYTLMNPDGRIESTFQLIATSAKASTFIAQSQVSSGWQYSRVDVSDDGRVVAAMEQKCGRNGGDMDPDLFELLKEQGMVARSDGCWFRNPDVLALAVTDGSGWPRATKEIFSKVDPKVTFALDKLPDAPKGNKPCDAPYHDQSVDAAFGAEEVSSSAGRRHVLAATRRAGTSVQYSIGIDAEGNQFGPWGYIGIKMSDGSPRMWCGVAHMMRVNALSSSKSTLSTPPAARDKVKQLCAETLHREGCGTIEEMLRRYGGEILMQGPQVHQLANGFAVYGDVLTVVARKGYGEVVVLTTAPSGLTEVLLRH